MAYYQVNTRNGKGVFVEDCRYTAKVFAGARPIPMEGKKRALNTARRRAAQRVLEGMDAEILNSIGVVYSVEEVRRNARKWIRLTDTQCGV